jgi:hypothetical protein
MSPVDVFELRPYRSAIFDNGRWERFEHRPGDIFVCTPPKCGTTWMQTIVASLLWPDGDVPGQVMTLSPWIDANFYSIDEILARLEAQSHRRFIKTHTPADGIPWIDGVSYVFVARTAETCSCRSVTTAKYFATSCASHSTSGHLLTASPPMPAWDGDVHGSSAFGSLRRPPFSATSPRSGLTVEIPTSSLSTTRT